MSTFDHIKRRVKEIGEIAGFSDKETDHLLKHQQVNHTVLEVNGEKMPAWRIVHNRALGPGKGGIRFHPEVSEDEVKSLSFWMSLKNSLAGLPYGGGKGGIKFNPKGRSEKELEAISRAYIDYFYPYIGQDKDVPAPDVYTNAQIMGWMVDEYEKKVGHHEPGVITGKPLELGGIALRSDSTAHGGYIVFKEMVSSLISPPKVGGARGGMKNITIAIQGFGNAGANMMKYLSDGGYTIVAVSDSKGGVYEPRGIQYSTIDKIKRTKGTVTAYAHSSSSSSGLTRGSSLKSSGSQIKSGMTTQISNEELLELDVDVLVLAALENQITKKNVGNIKARYVIELANGPVDLEADPILFKNGVTVVPDILANSGGVVVSYFEWAQNRTGNILDEKYLEDKLTKMMTEAWNKVYSLQQEHKGKIDLRTSAYVIAMRRILAVEKYRGNL